MAATPAAAPVLVKLGGSLLTRKREVEKLRPKVLSRLAEEIASVARDVPIVLLHGAGSFGHPGAKRFHLADSLKASRGKAERTRGAAIVATEVRRLHLHLLRGLVAAGLSPWSLPATTLSMNREGRLTSFHAAPFGEALARGLLPVTFGDVVPDEAWGFSILSADTIAAALVGPLRPRRVVFASDVPGIWVGPGRGARSVAPELTDEVLAALRPAPGAPDVTGGIRAKAEAMRAIARSGVDAVLISGLSDGAVARAIRGEEVYGSWAHARAA